MSDYITRHRNMQLHNLLHGVSLVISPFKCHQFVLWTSESCVCDDTCHTMFTVEKKGTEEILPLNKESWYRRNRNNIRGILSCLGGFLVELTLGNIFSFGNLTTYLTSYIRRRVDPSVGYNDTAWISSILLACQGGFMYIGGFLHRKYGARIATSVGCIITSVSVICTYWTIQTSYTLTVLSYGFFGGLGISLGYAPPLYAGPKWFPLKTGFVSGIVVSGFSLGALIFDQVQTVFINPKDLPVDPDGYFSDAEVLDRVPKVFLLLGGIFVILQVIGVAIMSDAPEELVNRALQPRHKPVQRSVSTRSLINGPLTNMDWKAMIRTPQFYLIWLIACLIDTVINFYQATYKTFGQSFIMSDHFLSTVGSVSSTCNALGRIVWGFFYDHSSYKFCMLIVSGILTVLTATLCFAPHVGDGEAFYALWISFVYFDFSGMLSILPSITAHTFGPKHSSENFGLIFSHAVVAGPLAAVFANVLEEVVGWTGQLLIVAAFALAAFILVSFYPGEFVPFRFCRRRLY